MDDQALSLQEAANDTSTPFHRLPTTLSSLKNEYSRLNHQSQYHILCHYSWLQPQNNQKSVSFPVSHYKGWNLEGSVRIRKSNYYLLDTDLNFSNRFEPASSFVFVQKKRLKDDVVYYLDHPQAGMLIKVHQVS